MLQNRLIITKKNEREKIYNSSKNKWIIEFDDDKLNNWEDFYKMDMLSKVVIIETIYNEIDTKTLFNKISVLKKMLKKLLICTKNTKIISDYFKDENGEYLHNLTELEIQKRYDDILKKLSK